MCALECLLNWVESAVCFTLQVYLSVFKYISAENWPKSYSFNLPHSKQKSKIANILSTFLFTRDLIYTILYTRLLSYFLFVSFLFYIATFIIILITEHHQAVISWPDLVQIFNFLWQFCEYTRKINRSNSNQAIEWRIHS